MKTIIVIAGMFLFFSPTVFAAKSVRGSVPSLSPLQPPPVYTYPSLNSNIQMHDSSHSEEFSSSTAGAPGSNQGAAQAGNEPPQSAALPPASASSISPAAKKIGWVLGLLIILGSGFWLVQKKKQ